MAGSERPSRCQRGRYCVPGRALWTLSTTHPLLSSSLTREGDSESRTVDTVPNNLCGFVSSAPFRAHRLRPALTVLQRSPETATAGPVIPLASVKGGKCREGEDLLTGSRPAQPGGSGWTFGTITPETASTPSGALEAEESGRMVCCVLSLPLPAPAVLRAGTVKRTGPSRKQNSGGDTPRHCRVLQRCPVSRPPRLHSEYLPDEKPVGLSPQDGLQIHLGFSAVGHGHPQFPNRGPGNHFPEVLLDHLHLLQIPT